MSYFLKSVFFYSKAGGIRFFVAVWLTVIASFAESFGFVLLIPLFSGLFLAEEEVSPHHGTLADVILGWFHSLGIEYNIATVALFILILISIKAVFLFFSDISRSRLKISILVDSQRNIMDRVTNSPFWLFEHMGLNYFHNLVTSQVMTVSNNAKVLAGVLAAIGAAFVYVGVAVYVSFFFGVAALFVGMSLLFAFKWLNKRIKYFSSRQAETSRSFSHKVLRYLESFKYLTATRRHGIFQSEIRDESVWFAEAQYSTLKNVAISARLREPIVVFAVVALVLSLAGSGMSIVGDTVVSILLFYRALSCVVGLQTSWAGFLSGRGSIELYRSSLATMDLAISEKPDGCDFKFDKFIELNDVSVKFSDGTVGLDSINLRVEKGSFVVIVGRSGAGKSTLVELLCGLVNSDAGVIIVDDKPLETLGSSCWQRNLGFVGQEPVVFDGTLRDNVVCCEMDLESADSHLQSRIDDALARSGLQDLAFDNFSGIGKMIRGEGSNLSGGQLQRLAFAREIFRKPDVLILDEPTSSLDRESDELIRHAILELKGTCTIFMVTHKVESCRDADLVVVMDEGRISASGSYEAVVLSNPSFFA